MPPIVGKTGSAFISNGFGRFINTSAKGEMTRGKTPFLEGADVVLGCRRASCLCLLHICAAKCACFKSDFGCFAWWPLQLWRSTHLYVQIARRFMCRLHADRALHRSGGLEHSIQ
jgi:hypothetical protein